MNTIYEVTTCPRCGAKIYEADFDHDLHCFDVYIKQDTPTAIQYSFLGFIVPNNIEDMKEIHKALKNGECPLCDNWQDGLGHTLGHGTN